MKELNHTYTYVHSPSNFPPIQVATWHWAEFYVLYSWSFLAIHFKYSRVIFFLEFFCLFFRFHYKYGHTVFCLSLFDLSHLVNGLKVHSCCHRWQELLLFYGWIVFYCVYVCKYHIYIIFSLPIHPSMNTYVVVMS